jgi:hypothetical protein
MSGLKYETFKKGQLFTTYTEDDAAELFMLLFGRCLLACSSK